MNFGSKEEESALKRYIVSLLVQQAKSDGHFTNTEKKYLAFASRALNLSDAEVAAVRRSPAKYKIAPPTDEEQRMTILYYLLFMMKADQQIEPEEEKMCYLVGFRLGFREEMIADLIDLMRKYLQEEMPPDGMVKKVKPYLN